MQLPTKLMNFNSHLQSAKLVDKSSCNFFSWHSPSYYQITYLHILKSQSKCDYWKIQNGLRVTNIQHC